MAEDALPQYIQALTTDILAILDAEASGQGQADASRLAKIIKPPLASSILCDSIAKRQHAVRELRSTLTDNPGLAAEIWQQEFGRDPRTLYSTVGSLSTRLVARAHGLSLGKKLAGFQSQYLVQPLLARLEPGARAEDSVGAVKLGATLEANRKARAESRGALEQELQEKPILTAQLLRALRRPAPVELVVRVERYAIDKLEERKWCFDLCEKTLEILDGRSSDDSPGLPDLEKVRLEKAQRLHEALRTHLGTKYPAGHLSLEQLRERFLESKNEIGASLYAALQADPVLITELCRQLDAGPPSDRFKGGQLGLALSGGGIRSATFSLGILQGLAELGLLRRFSFLSTVSGGGYIGSWLAAWLKRKGLFRVHQQLRPDWKEHGGLEPPEIVFLRDYSNYLTPELGLFSADTWTLIAVYVRNLLLNLTILILSISAALLLPRLLVELSSIRTFASYYLLLSVLLVLLAVYYTGRNMAVFQQQAKARTAEYPPYAQPGRIRSLVALPVLFSAWMGSCWLWLVGKDQRPWWRWVRFREGTIGSVDFSSQRPASWWEWLLLGVFASSLLWFLAYVIAHYLGSRRKDQGPPSRQETEALEEGDRAWKTLLCWSPIVGIVVGLSLAGLAALFRFGRSLPGYSLHFVAWGTALVAAVYGVAVATHIGLMGRKFPDSRREWWSRVGAWSTIFTLGWLGLFTVSLYSPLIVLWANRWVKAAAVLGWLTHTVAGALAGRSAKTDGKEQVNGTQILIKTAPVVFVVGLLVLLSFGIYRALPPHGLAEKQELTSVVFKVSWSAGASQGAASVVGENDKPPSFRSLSEAFFSTLLDERPRGVYLFLLVLALGFVALLLSWRVDVNEFSMHLLYRNRLVRCYLGASHEGDKHERRPNPFTGFDPYDDLHLADLGGALRDESEDSQNLDYAGPYPILNTTLNVTHGKRLAWQERKAESFFFTPDYCGFDASPDVRRSPETKKNTVLEDTACRPTAELHGAWLGTAMAISGAAASPNMGYHSSSALAFLMTVLDVRLGWWTGNPRRQKTWQHETPTFGIFYLLLELFGLTDAESEYVYLSDGGHFENLGIYELVRRRCRLIVACDGSADENYALADLGDAIRKCRIDFGVDIEIDASDIRLQEHTRRSGQHCALGIIHYEHSDPGERPGILLYVKASLTGDEPTDILAYKNNDGKFPHDTTANQWFSESQFESYRRLGLHVIEKCDESGGPPPSIRLGAPTTAGAPEPDGKLLSLLDLIRKADRWSTFADSTELKQFLHTSVRLPDGSREPDGGRAAHPQ
jgi:hypothetical protein